MGQPIQPAPGLLSAKSPRRGLIPDPMKHFKKFFRNPYLVSGAGLVLVGAVLIIAWIRHEPTRQITQAELQNLIEKAGLVDGRVTPTPYAGIYEVEGKRNVNGRLQKVSITAHLDESQVKSLFGQKDF